jgi:hypothetical protein
MHLRIAEFLLLPKYAIYKLLNINFMRKLTRSQYLKAWGDLIGNADVRPERLRLDISPTRIQETRESLVTLLPAL